MSAALRSVLIIDDESDVRDGIKRVLGRAGYEVRTLGDGSKVLAEMRRNPAELVITDIIMPKISGVEIIELILQEFPATRILAISGGGNFDMTVPHSGDMITTTYLAAARRAGARHVLTKPFDSNELLQVVDLVMNADRH